MQNPSHHRHRKPLQLCEFEPAGRHAPRRRIGQLEQCAAVARGRQRRDRRQVSVIRLHMGADGQAEGGPLGGGIGIGMRKSDTELRAKFDEAIKAMKADGSLNAMIVKYFGEDSDKF